MSGKRKVGLKTARKILGKLPLSKIEKQSFLMDSLLEEKKTPAKLLSADQLEIVSGWEHFAILSLMETKNFQSSVKYIAQKINLDPSAVMRALDRLERVGLIRKQNGIYRLNQESVTTTTQIPSQALRNCHRQYIEKSLYSLEHHSADERDITGMTMAINMAKLPAAKRLIQEFRKSLAELLEQGPQEQVYRLNIQLFPLKK